MSQKRHEKVLRRKARMGSRTKERREDRRRQKVEGRRVDFETVFGSLLHGQLVEGASANRLDPGERARMSKIQEMFQGVTWRKKGRTSREQRRVTRVADLTTLYDSLLSGVAEGDGTDEQIRCERALNRLHGEAGEG
jgi:hypothetical protein